MSKFIMLFALLLLSISVHANITTFNCPEPSIISKVGVQFWYYDSESEDWYFRTQNQFGTPYDWRFLLIVGGSDLSEATANAAKYIQTLSLVSANTFPHLYSCTYNTAERMSAANATARYLSKD